MSRIPNEQRSEATTGRLLDAARELFAAHGYAGTSTPALVDAAGLSRGALYHHFRDKRDLLRAVVAQEGQRVAAAIEKGARGAGSPRDELRDGARAYLDAMTEPGRTRLLLIEAPAALGEEAGAIDAATAQAELRAGLDAARPQRDNAALAVLLSAAFDRAALEIAAGRDAASVRTAIDELLDAVAG